MPRVAMLATHAMQHDVRFEREASALASAGHEVYIFALEGEGLPSTEQRDGYSIHRVAKATDVGWSRPLEKRRQLAERERSLARSASAIRPDVIHCRDTDTLSAGLAAAEETQGRVIYDAFELYPDMLQEFGLRGSWPVQQYWKSIERTLILRCDAVIAPTDARAKVLAERYGVRPRVIRSLAPLVPLAHQQILRKSLGISDKTLVALYQGALVPGRDLEVLVRAMASVSGVRLVLQGPGALRGALESLVAEEDVAGTVHVLDAVPAERTHEYACGADIGLVTVAATTLNNRLAAPSKLYGYMMAGLALGVSDLPDLSAVATGEGIGVSFDSSSASDIALGLQQLAGDRAKLAQMKQRSRALAETEYNWDRESQKLLDLYDEIL